MLQSGRRLRRWERILEMDGEEWTRSFQEGEVLSGSRQRSVRDGDGAFGARTGLWICLPSLRVGLWTLSKDPLGREPEKDEWRWVSE